MKALQVKKIVTQVSQKVVKKEKEKGERNVKSNVRRKEVRYENE